MNPIKELKEIENEVSKFDKKLASEISDTTDELKKTAGIIESGDKIICVSPVQGLYKGRRYVCSEVLTPPNIGVIEEDDDSHTRVGIYRLDRFCKFHNEY